MVSPLNPHVNAHPTAGAYTNAFVLAVEMEQAGIRSTAKAIAVTRHFGMLLETRIKANASGRPGPRAKTGDYRRSWTTTLTLGTGGASATVGTNKPQARRLEYGFVGADRIGRVYDQPPFPHVGPAFDQTAPEFEQAMAQLLTLGNTTLGGIPTPSGMVEYTTKSGSTRMASQAQVNHWTRGGNS